MFIDLNLFIYKIINSRSRWRVKKVAKKNFMKHHVFLMMIERLGSMEQPRKEKNKFMLM
jgi:hypothetical protein